MVFFFIRPNVGSKIPNGRVKKLSSYNKSQKLVNINVNGGTFFCNKLMVIEKSQCVQMSALQKVCKFMLREKPFGPVFLEISQ